MGCRATELSNKVNKLDMCVCALSHPSSPVTSNGAIHTDVTPHQPLVFNMSLSFILLINHSYIKVVVIFPYFGGGRGSPVLKISDHGRHVMSSSPEPLKTHRVGQRCTLNLSRAETSSCWCGVVVRRGGCQLRCRPRHLTMVQNYVVRRQKPSCS
ncbi:uncharacterized protein TNCV_4738321 [Trichonephila clavipes]|nr:uncharacterized protein TNCV_4738321 [Trichonephila clavipes]